jgi:hypothetical protein
LDLLLKGFLCEIALCVAVKIVCGGVPYGTFFSAIAFVGKITIYEILG